jgi:hypothetical protein
MTTKKIPSRSVLPLVRLPATLSQEWSMVCSASVILPYIMVVLSLLTKLTVIPPGKLIPIRNAYLCEVSREFGAVLRAAAKAISCNSSWAALSSLVLLVSNMLIRWAALELLPRTAVPETGFLLFLKEHPRSFNRLDPRQLDYQLVGSTKDVSSKLQ